MRHFIFTVVLVVSATALSAQQTPARLDAGELVVATVNGESITRARFTGLWNALPESTRTQYEQSGGGRVAFLDTVIRRRLILQDAVSKGYDQWPEISSKPEDQRESALFDLYVREIVAPRIVTDDAVRAFYDGNPDKFVMPGRVKLRLIAVSLARRMPAEARELVTGIAAELFSLKSQTKGADSQAFVEAFAAKAQEHSEHPSAAAGGDLGWVNPDKLDTTLAAAAKNVPEMTVSGVLQTPGAFLLMLVEKRIDSTVVAYDSARDAIREHLLNKSSGEIVAAAAIHAATLRDAADVKLHPGNLR